MPKQRTTLDAPEGANVLGYLSSGRPIVRNDDGTVSTHRNMRIEMDGRHWIVPTMFGGKAVHPDDAISIVRENRGIDPDTRQPVPSFDSADAAAEAEKILHDALEDELRQLGLY